MKQLATKVQALSLCMLALVVGAFAPVTAHAAIDTTAVLASVADAESFISTVAIAVLALMFLIKAFRWAKRAG